MNGDRELIVTNWTENEKGKPFIPAHLQQPSAIQAIEEIAAMIRKRERLQRLSREKLIASK
jgi:hypothetical protein